MTLVKICGCMRPEDAMVAVRAGADFVGIVFVVGVRRQVGAGEGKYIVEAAREASMTAGSPAPEPVAPQHDAGGEGWFQRWAREVERRLSVRRPLVVGVFANQPAEFINETVEECDLDLVQFSGSEPWELALSIVRPVLKSVKVRPGWTPADVLAALKAETAALPIIEPHVDGVLGGAGVRTDWDLASAVAARVPIVLSGGLDPDNVAEAVRRVRPWAVDVSSGVESDGSKDPAKIRAFVATVRGHSRIS
jgi:phosphoribosylanthranilate isomerase